MMQQLPFFVRDIEYHITNAYNAGYDIESIPNYIVNEYVNTYTTENDKKLLNLFFKKEVSQEDLDKFLSEWDIEKEGGHKALLLAYFMKKHPELNYPQYVEPRLQGILKFYKYRNLISFANFHKICSAIKKKNIDILVIKGCSIKHRNPSYPRIMGDMDILVHEKDYITAVETALSFGYKYYSFSHSIDIYDPKVGFLIDIHHKFDLHTCQDRSIYDDLFDRSKREKVYNVDDINVPCPEDMMFILLTNMNKNLAQHTCGLSLLYYIADSMLLLNLKPDFDWDIVKNNIIKTKTQIQALIAAKFLNEFVPEKLPELFADEFNERCLEVINYKPVFLAKIKKDK